MSTMARAPLGAKSFERAETCADYHAELVARRASRPIATGGRLFPTAKGIADHIEGAIQAWHGAYPDPGATEHQCANHEGGHFVTAEAVRLGASFAQIDRPRSRGGGWTGRMIAQRQPLHGCTRIITAADIEREAVLILAGPLAEQIHGGGDAYGSPGEILEFSVAAARLADMRGEERAATLRCLWTVTTGIVIGSSEQIERIAARLKSASKQRCGIFRDSYGIPKILSSIAPLSPKQAPSLTTAQENASNYLFNNAPVDLIRFVEEIDR